MLVAPLCCAVSVDEPVITAVLAMPTTVSDLAHLSYDPANDRWVFWTNSNDNLTALPDDHTGSDNIWENGVSTPDPSTTEVEQIVYGDSDTDPIFVCTEAHGVPYLHDTSGSPITTVSPAPDACIGMTATADTIYALTYTVSDGTNVYYLYLFKRTSPYTELEKILIDNNATAVTYGTLVIDDSDQILLAIGTGVWRYDLTNSHSMVSRTSAAGVQVATLEKTAIAASLDRGNRACFMTAQTEDLPVKCYAISKEVVATSGAASTRASVTLFIVVLLTSVVLSLGFCIMLV